MEREGKGKTMEWGGKGMGEGWDVVVLVLTGRGKVSVLLIVLREDGCGTRRGEGKTMGREGVKVEMW